MKMKPILVSDYRLRDACALSNVKNYAAAAGLLAEYLVDHPGDVEAMFSYAVCLADLHRYGDAWNVVRELLRMAPDHVMGLNLAACLAGSQGMAFGKLARYDFRRALELAPSSPLVQWNYSLWQIQHGEWGEGWARYEWGVAAGHRPVRMHGPLWDGQTGLDGKTLFVWAEQGLGDSIMALQVLYSVAMAHPRCRIVLEVPAALVRLARESGVAARVCSPVADGSVPERFDFHVSLMSLIRFYCPSPECLPLARNYLRCREAEAEWADRLRGYGGFRVGLVWAGNAAHPNDWNRSVAPSVLLPLLGRQAAFFSFQQGWEPERVELELPGVVPLGHLFGDLADTAGALRNMDILIAVDTSVAHLGGACGMPAVWMLTPVLCDYRWGLGRSWTPWYDNFELFRQTEIGRWDDVIARMVAML